MLTKPDGCRGCSFYQDGRGFVPDEVRTRASVYIMGQNPGAEEESQGIPFVGLTGQMMEKKYLPLTGLNREDVSLGNILRCRYRPWNKVEERWGLPTNELPLLNQRIVRDAIEHCQRAHWKRPEATKVIVTQGDYALWGLTGETSSTDWRGYILAYPNQDHLRMVWTPDNQQATVLATVHLARLFRESTLTLATMSDWGKVARLLKRTWPQPPPTFLTSPPDAWPQRFSFDTEFPRKYPRKLIRYSMYDGSVGRVVEARDHRVPRGLRTGRESDAPRPTVISQYAPADMAHLARLSKRDVWQAFTVDDTIWKHAVLYPLPMVNDEGDRSERGAGSSLNYFGSIWSSMNRWKHLAEVNPQLYAGADAYGTWEVDQAFERSFDNDPRSRQVYEQIDRPVLPDFVRAQYRGLQTDQGRVETVIQVLQREKQDAQARARAITGWPLNLGSPQQVTYRLYTVERLCAPQARQ